MNIGIIGCGHMGTAIAKALLSKKIGRVLVSNPVCPKIKVNWTVDNREVVKKSDIVIVAVKPNVVASVLSEIRQTLRPSQILISIAAGVPLKKLQKFSKHKKIARVMPNLPAQVFDGMSVWKALRGLHKKERGAVRKLLQSFGKEIEARDEKLIDMATAVSGCGPAYVAAFLESMASQTRKAGFSAGDSRLLALETVNGTLDYIKETNMEFSALKNLVQTKGGATEAAFKVLKKKKWQKVFEQAISAAYRRARKLAI